MSVEEVSESLAAIAAAEMNEALTAISSVFEGQRAEYARQKDAIVGERRLEEAIKWDGLFEKVDKALLEADRLLRAEQHKRVLRGRFEFSGGVPKYCENLTVKVKQAILSAKAPRRPGIRNTGNSKS
jgi:hypothetical protein